MSELENKYKAWESRINQEYTDLFSETDDNTGETFVPDFLMDGVIHPDKYNEAKIKILFLNREPNDDGASDWLNHTLRTKIENNERIFTNKNNNDFTLNLLGEYLVIQLLSIEDSVIMTDDEINDWVTNRVNRYPDQFQDFMLYTAYINLKKIGGGPKIDSQEKKNKVIEATARGWKIIEKQIIYFNPTIIVGGNISRYYLDADDNRIKLEWIGKPEYITSKSNIPLLQDIIIGDKVFPLLDLYHPSVCYEHKGYNWAQVYHLLKSKENTNKDYWKNRFNQSCFN